GVRGDDRARAGDGAVGADPRDDRGRGAEREHGAGDGADGVGDGVGDLADHGAGGGNPGAGGFDDQQERAGGGGDFGAGPAPAGGAVTPADGGGEAGLAGPVAVHADELRFDGQPDDGRDEDGLSTVQDAAVPGRGSLHP